MLSASFGRGRHAHTGTRANGDLTETHAPHTADTGKGRGRLGALPVRGEQQHRKTGGVGDPLAKPCRLDEGSALRSSARTPSSTMRITTPEVVWHGGEAGKNDPILSVDVHPCGVLATSGADGEVRFWKLRLEENEENKFQEYLYAFENHERSVNCVRFSPDGRMLATASDGGHIVLFSLPEGRPPRFWRERLCARKVQAMVVRTAQADIYDLAWGPSSEEFASVSVDNRVCFWSMAAGGKKALPVTTFTSHQNYVQGVAWDPRDRFVVSQSNDRSCRVYKKREEGKGKGKGKKKRPAGPPFTEVSLMRLASRPEDVAKEEETCYIVAAKVSSSSPSAGRRRVMQEDEDSDDGKPAAAAAANGQGGEAEGASAAAAAAAAVPEKVKRAPRPHLFADETVPSFFRRPAWSPDGCLLLTPCGLHKRASSSSGHASNSGSGGGGGKTEYVTHVFSRSSFANPVLELPHPGARASVAVRFCPQVFKLKDPTAAAAAAAPMAVDAAAAAMAEEEGKAEPSAAGPVAAPGLSSASAPPLTNLPYRMVFAVVTVAGVLVYDTQHHFPLAFVKNAHYAPLTDVAWLADGSALVATSMDGYVTVLSFPDGELGAPLEVERVPPPARAMHKAYYDGVLHAAEDEEEERAEMEERRQRAERKAAERAEKAAKKEARKLLKKGKKGNKREGGEDGGEVDGEEEGQWAEESTAASSSCSSSCSSSRASGSSKVSRASRPKTRGAGKAKGKGPAGSDIVDLLDSEMSSDEEEEEGAEKGGGKKEEAAVVAVVAGAKGKEKEEDGESLQSEEMSEDENEEEEEEEEEDEDEEGENKESRWEKASEKKASSSPASVGNGGGKKRPSSEMEEGAEADAPSAPQQAQPRPQAAKKRIKPTLVSASLAVQSSPASASASSSSSSSSSSSAEASPAGTENDPAAANVNAASSSAAAAATKPAAEARGAKPKKRVAPTLVSSKI